MFVWDHAIELLEFVLHVLLQMRLFLDLVQIFYFRHEWGVKPTVVWLHNILPDWVKNEPVGPKLRRNLVQYNLQQLSRGINLETFLLLLGIVVHHKIKFIFACGWFGVQYILSLLDLLQEAHLETEVFYVEERGVRIVSYSLKHDVSARKQVTFNIELYIGWYKPEVHRPWMQLDHRR